MLTPAEWWRVLAATAIATILAVRGRKRGSLSRSGAASAFFVGFASFSSGARFGWTLIAFYLSATRATRFRAGRKKVLEDGFSTENGNRGAGQVLASSLPAVVVSGVYAWLFRDDVPVSASIPLRAELQLAYLLFFAACAGDTFASELGSVLGDPTVRPRLLVAPWRAVPRGTNGAVSTGGTVASALGGAVVGAVFLVTGPAWTAMQCRLVLVGALGGLLGSALDSVLGALLQASFYDPVEGKVLKEKPDPTSPVGKRAVHVTGVDLLSGEAVNLAAAVLTSGIAPLLTVWFQVESPS